MTMNNIMTNKIVFSKSCEKLDEKFDIVCLKTNQQYFRFNSTIFDMPLMNKNVEAILYSESTIFLLLKKGRDNIQLIWDELKDVDDFEHISAQLISSSEMKDFQLLQLLLNSLWNFTSEEFKTNNVTGHLYYFLDEWCFRGSGELKNDIVKVCCIEISVDNNMHIKLLTRTFTSEKIKNTIHFGKTKYESYPKYILNSNGTLTRKLKSDTGTEFIMRNSGKKREIAFLDISNYKKFLSSKMGVLYQTVTKFSEKFKNIACIGLETVPVSESVYVKKSDVNRNVIYRNELLLNYSINCIDKINNEESIHTTNVIKEIFKTNANENNSIIRITEYNEPQPEAFNLVLLHEKEYYEEKDPYLEKYDNYAIQHITIESIKNNINHIVRTATNELLIKRDLINRKITLYDWEKLGLSSKVIFITKTTENDENTYYLMIINPDGTFVILVKKDFDPVDQYTFLLDYFMIDERIDNLIVDSAGNVVSIWDTGWYTVPDIFEIVRNLREGNTKLRSKEKRDCLLKAVTDIKSFVMDNDTYYYVGVIGDGMQSVIANASHIRKYEQLKGSGSIKEVLQLMNNSFIRNGQYTVLPFPMKYIREEIERHK